MTTAAPSRSAGAVLRDGWTRLAACGIPTARQDAEWLLAAVLGVERFDLYREPAREVTDDAADRYQALLERRAGHEPLQHLLGFEDFRGLRLRVGPDVLVPRPETEGLVEWVVEALRDQPDAVVADVGTGSGAIACALAASLPYTRVLAVDCCPRALAVARANVAALGLADRITLLEGDLGAPLAPWRGGLDAIVANLPYLPAGVIATLPREVSAFEPRLALDGGPDGLRVLRRLIAAAPQVLRPGGWLLMEIGEDQAGALASLMAAEGFTAIASRQDLRGVERYIGGRVPGPGITAPSPRRVCG
jgi:release factor glutamine methyltransferase